MGFLLNLKELVFGSKRKLQRNELQKFLALKVKIDGYKYSIKDFSGNGFALNNEEGRALFEIGKVYPCVILVLDQPRLTVKVEIVRIEGKVIGCKVLDQDLFQRFIQTHLRH